MNYEILNLTPISGDFEEKHFGETDANPLWIKFILIDSNCWIGSFASGDIGLVNEKIVEIDKSSKIGILTNGAFYLIDKDSRDLILHPESGFFTDFEILLDQDLIFLATNWGIYILKNNSQIKEIRPDFIDGIRFTKKTDTKLLGEIYEPVDEWIDFEFDIPTL
jgi:hypothetical protein